MIDRAIAFDLETHAFRRGNKAPRPVCVSVCETGGMGCVLAGVEARDRIARLYREASPERPIVGHNVAFDSTCVLAHVAPAVDAVWDAYVRGAVHDTMIREQLLDLRVGKLVSGRGGLSYYSLAACADRRLGIQLEKGADTWRTRYGELDGVALELWPAEAVAYARRDAETTAALWRDQEERAAKVGYTMPDQALQVRGALALALISAWGIHVDPAAVEALSGKIRDRMIALSAQLTAGGVLRRDGSKNLAIVRDRVERALGETTPRTEASAKHPRGQVVTDGDTLLSTRDPVLVGLAEYQGLQQQGGTFVEALREGCDGWPIHTGFCSLLESGRTSSFGPNLQNQPRMPGVRECFVPRPGNVFVEADYDSQEMRCWAQACVDLTGRSRLADAYRADPHFDPHAAFAEANWPEAKDGRQQAKAANFGLPGGMGARTLVKYASGYGVFWDEDRAKRVIDAWRAMRPESRDYFDVIQGIVGPGGPRSVTQLRSGRVRGGLGFCDAANTLFQGLGADASKDALFQAARRCYGQVPGSALSGSRIVNFVHDSIMLESPIYAAPDAAEELVAVMVEAMARWTPNVPPAASPVLMRRWSKKAKTIRDAAGRLMVWEG